MTHRSKVMVLTVLSVLLPVAVILALMVRFEDVVSRKATKELDQLAKVNVGQIARDVYGICEISHDLIQQKINHDLAVAHIVAEKGKISTGVTPVPWQAINQFTGKTEAVVLPGFVVGKSWLRKNDDTRKPTPLVDDLERLVGGTCTIFQRMNYQGDMLRVASNIVGADGKRTIGTYIPAVNPDGAPNPIVSNILQGQTYRCLTYLMNSWYLIAYEPLRNKSDNVIGMLCVGEQLEAVASLRKTITEIQVGKSGEVGIIGTKGKYQGRYIISRESTKDGIDIWNAKDDAERYYVQSIVRKALGQPRGAVVYETYTLRDPGESRPQRKIAAAMYFEPYDWFILVSTSESDFYSSLHRMDDSIRRLLWEIVVVGLCFLILAVVLALFLGKEMTKLLHFMTTMAKNIATGDLRKVKQDLATEFQKQGKRANGKAEKDETETLLGAFSDMTERLDTSFSRVQQSSVPFKHSVAGKMLSRQAISKTVNTSISYPQMTPITEEMAKEISHTQTHLDQTIDVTKESRRDLTEMEDSMLGLSGVSARISSQLAVINDQTNQISDGITAMTAIAEQANLLALNASITAEKAGKFGKGYALVARDAGRLSHRTEAAAQLIGGIVKEIKTTTSAGLMESDILSSTVQKTVSGVATVRNRLAMVVDQLQVYDAQLEKLRLGFQDKSVEGKRVDDAISRLSEVSARAKESLKQFKLAMDGLKQPMDGIQSKLSDQGFSVVAREVKQMADQTMIAAGGIDAVVNELQASLADGSVAKDILGGDVRKSVEKTVKISEQLCMVIDHLRTYDFQSQGSQTDFDGQSTEGTRIDNTMGQLDAASRQARESLQDFRLATEGLVQALGGLPEGSSETRYQVPSIDE